MKLNKQKKSISRAGSDRQILILARKGGPRSHLRNVSSISFQYHWKTRSRRRAVEREREEEDDENVFPTILSRQGPAARTHSPLKGIKKKGGVGEAEEARV